MEIVSNYFCNGDEIYLMLWLQVTAVIWCVYMTYYPSLYSQWRHYDMDRSKYHSNKTRSIYIVYGGHFEKNGGHCFANSFLNYVLIMY